MYVAPDSPSNPYWNQAQDCAGECGGDAVLDCNGVCNGDAMADDCGDCQLAYCYDYVSHTVNYDFPCDGPTEMYVAPDSPSNPYWNQAQDCAGECGGDSVVDECGVCGGTGAPVGDSNDDCILNVLDIVSLVQIIINGLTPEYDADFNGDDIVNILDVVQLVGFVVNGSVRVSDATSADMMITDNSLSLTSNGYIGGIQMTLSHDNGFELDLTDNAMVAEYKTSGTSTILVVVEPNDELIFTTNQSFDIVEMIVANSSEEILVNTISEFGLSSAYPNPFNPSTSVTLTVPSADYISVKVYNLMGQMVGTLADGMMEANVYTFTWDASDVSSGVYLIKAESSSSVDIQKVLLVK